MPPRSPCPRGRAHWETLLRARAIENLCYVVAPAQAGTHSSGRETYGDSIIIDYWGQVLSRLAKGTGVITADIDLAKEAETRLRFPALDNRQLGLSPCCGGFDMNARSVELSMPMFDVAQKMILAPSGLDEGRLTTVLDAVMSRGVDYADLYFQLSREESCRWRTASSKRDRTASNRASACAPSAARRRALPTPMKCCFRPLLEASDAARAIARSGGKNAVKAWKRPLTHRLYLPVDPLDAIRDEDKVQWLMRIDADDASYRSAGQTG